MTQSTELAVWWLRMSLGDLADARAIVVAGEVPIRGAAFLAQQSAEKALKGAIVAIGEDPPRIHDLKRLAAAVPTLFVGETFTPDLTRLTAVVVTARYPDPDDPPFELEEVEQLIFEAAAVIGAVRAHFARLGIAATGIEAI